MQTLNLGVAERVRLPRLLAQRVDAEGVMIVLPEPLNSQILGQCASQSDRLLTLLSNLWLQLFFVRHVSSDTPQTFFALDLNLKSALQKS